MLDWLSVSTGYADIAKSPIALPKRAESVAVEVGEDVSGVWGGRVSRFRTASHDFRVDREAQSEVAW